MFLADLGIHAGSAGLQGAFPVVAGALGAVLGGGVGRSALIGAGIGGVAGLAQGDNYSSTAAARNFMVGASLGGLAGGVGKWGIPKIPGAVTRGGQLVTQKAGPYAFTHRTALGAAAGGIMGYNSSEDGSISGAIGGAMAGAGLARYGAKAIAAGRKSFASASGIAGISQSSNMMHSVRTGVASLTRNISRDYRKATASYKSFQNSTAGLALGLHRKRHR